MARPFVGALAGEVTDIYTAGMVQGLALVTFPAASTVLTSPQHYGLSSIEYATMFVPQAAMAVGASLLGARLIRHFGIKRIYLIGLTANLVSMALLFLSQFAISNAPVAYGMLILATTNLGIGFGLTVPALNTFAAAFFPRKIDSAVLILNALLGLGTVLAPVLVAVFIGLSIWSGLPLLVAVLLLVLLLFSLHLPLQTGTSEPEQGHKRPAIAAFSVGPLQQQAKLSLNTLFGATVIFALAMSALSFVIAKHEEMSASGFGVRTSSNMIDRQIRRRKIS